jgi:dTDP-4-dehydrorhamnose reductase
LAAFTDVSKAYEEKDDKEGLVYRVNVTGTENIARAAKKFGHYLIHISTDFVFDGANPPQAGYTEKDKPQPIEWYGQTKLWAEEAVQKVGGKHVIVRTAFPFRANFPGKLDLVRNMLDKLKTNSLFPMFTDQIITPTFTDDLCLALRMMIDSQPTGIFHAVGSSWVSPYELAQKAAKIFGIKAEIKEGSFKEYMLKDPRPRQQYLKISNAKLKRELGVTMKTIDEALKNLKDQVGET